MSNLIGQAVLDNNLDKLLQLIISSKNKGCINRRIIDSEMFGCSALHLACVHGYFECAKLLVSYGANLNMRNHHNTTPLILSTRKNRVSIVELLLNNNADINAIDDSFRNALIWGCICGQYECVQLLLSNGCRRDDQDFYGYSALMYAVKQNSIQCIILLLEYDADYESLNKEGKSVMDMSTSDEVRRLILDKMSANIVLK
jgi:ankyrin repeat protein